MNVWMGWYAFLMSVIAMGGVVPATTMSGTGVTRQPPAKAAPTGSASAGSASAEPGGTTISRDGARITVRRSTIAGQAAPKLAAATTISPMDFDRDGKDDPVVGAFLYGGYGVIVNYSGLPQRDYITAPVPSPTRPNFGDSMTSGDFNGDGYADLAVANSGEFAPSGDAPQFGGGVWIFYGSATGLNLMAPQHFTQDTDGLPGTTMQGYDMFGSGLAAGDINGDGRADLAVGAYGDKINGHEWAGSVTVLFGSPTGLTTSGAQLITQDSGDVPTVPEPSDTFGSALAIGDMTGDGYADLAISAPSEGEWSQPFEGGVITLLRGGPNGIVTTGTTSFLGVSLGLGAIGDSLSIADIDGDGDGDLVAGVPRSWIGYLVYVPGIPTGMDVPRARVISLDTPGVPGVSQDFLMDTMQTWFGYAVATGDVTGDGRADVLTGSIGYDVDGVADAGAVFLIPGTADGLTGAGSLMLTQSPPDTTWQRRPGPGPVAFERPEFDDEFGQANAILNLDGIGPLDMVTSTEMEKDAGDQPIGLLVWLDLEYSTPRRPLPGEEPVGSYPIRLIARKAGTGPSFGAYSIGHTLLHR